MLNVLLESRAPRARRMGSTVTSAVVHASLIAGAVALTLPGPVKATNASPRDPVYIVPPPTRPAAPRKPRGGTPRDATPRGAMPAAPRLPTIAAPTVVPVSLPPIDAGPALPPDQIVIGGPGVATASPIGGSSAIGSGGSAIDERLVDRAPRLLVGAAEPRYPASLRDAGVQGRVVVQFVVDTLGRAEVGELQVIETPHALFVDAVRAALGRYRFTVGEAGGHKVRTRVQIPFDFMLTR
jgi:protein TonB